MVDFLQTTFVRYGRLPKSATACSSTFAEVFDDLQSGQLFSLLSGFPLLAFQLAWSIHRGGTWRHVPA